MDKIPPEILRGILSHLDSRRRLSPYATVCRAFQFEIEARTFAKLKITSTESMERLDAVLADNRRRYLLRTLTFIVRLPFNFGNYWSDQRYREEQDRCYTVAVNDLFVRLHKWASPNAAPFNLSIFTQLLSSVSKNHRAIKFNERQVLPSVACVDKFKDVEQKLHPSVIPIIFKVRPGIKHFSWKIDASSCLTGVLRSTIRASTALTLSQANFLSLEVLQLHQTDDIPANQSQYPPSYVDSQGHDRLSLALNRILKLPNLKELDLCGAFTLSPEIFNLDESDVVSKSVRSIRLDLSKLTPAGEWYFTGRRGVGRQHANPTTLDPFLVALARAAVRMPALDSFSCLFPGTAFLRYYAPGTCEPCRTAECAFVFSASDSSRWIMHFEMSSRCKDGRPLLSNWNLPSELVEVLKRADHRILLMRGCLGLGYTSEEV
ncbi:hypothetical protein F4818DRAFT_261551 [Hypoxylon cercidicola]|nr:hypothetical protein F4818DRAFT_261551 [Hypoxylon cercidicola]